MDTRQRIPCERGRSVSIRVIEPTDADPLRAFYAALSPESRRRRFLGASSGISKQQAERFAKELGVVAVLHEQGPDDGALVGHACLPLIEPGVAEAAVAVADAYQGAGIGRALLAAAVTEARESGIRRLVASMFADNAAIHRLLLGPGLPYRRLSAGGGVDALEIEVAAAPEGSVVGRPKGTPEVGPWVPQTGRTAPSGRSHQPVR